MDDSEVPGQRSKSDGGNRAVLPIWVAAVAAALILAAYGTWHLSRRAEVLRSSGVSLSFALAPDTVAVKVPSRFVVRVRGPDGAPMPGRPINLAVTPEGKAILLSVSGNPVSTRTAWGRTDDSGHVEALVRAETPGEYQLAAADSGGASAAGVSAGFQAR